MSSEIKKNEENEMSFFEHLEELRWHIIRSLIAVAVLTTVFFIFRDFIFQKIIIAPKNENFLTYRVMCAISEATCMKPPEFQFIITG